MKRCSKCAAKKDLSQFFADSSKRDGLRPDCKDCVAATKGRTHGVGRIKPVAIGAKFGRLTSIEAPTVVEGITKIRCRCECGAEKLFQRDHLFSGRSKSCGCLRKQVVSEVKGTHRMSKSRLYRRWASMRARCTNPNCRHFHRYGGRGISVCAEWQSFQNFFEWAMQSGYEDGLEIDRIDNDGDYSPENCRWITHQENCRNRVHYAHR